ncbi:hypothetical protein [Bacillus sp. CECT 9360]|uniref:hypothetical protein n=1 Tax=Bacillus sp. CECT 9360 TaxID=2845821 RepID=UPI001E45019C|nr:hypothetical protein [Bacillus sp. CECT 9360]CAH0345049.1 hypothetical protein BCI9360_01326 [Bacillus sp. CECT 9360]
MNVKHVRNGIFCLGALFILYKFYEYALGAVSFLLLSIFFFWMAYRQWKNGRVQ